MHGTPQAVFKTRNRGIKGNVAPLNPGSTPGGGASLSSSGEDVGPSPQEPGFESPQRNFLGACGGSAEVAERERDLLLGAGGAEGLEASGALDGARRAKDGVDGDLRAARRVRDDGLLGRARRAHVEGVGVALRELEEAKVADDEHAHDPERLPRVVEGEVAQAQQGEVDDEEQVHQKVEHAGGRVAVDAPNGALLAREQVELVVEEAELGRLDLAVRLELVKGLAQQDNHGQEGHHAVGGELLRARKERGRSGNGQHLELDRLAAVGVLDHVGDAGQDQADLGGGVHHLGDRALLRRLELGVHHDRDAVRVDERARPDRQVDAHAAEVAKVADGGRVLCKVGAEPERDEEDEHGAQRVHDLLGVHVLLNEIGGAVDVLDDGHAYGGEADAQQRRKDDTADQVEGVGPAEVGGFHAETTRPVNCGGCLGNELVRLHDARPHGGTNPFSFSWRKRLCYLLAMALRDSNSLLF